MPTASGLQIAFLAFAVAFFSMLASSHATHALGLPPSAAALVGETITFATAAFILVGVGTLRRACLEEFRREVPQWAIPEAALAALAKCAVPPAVLGATAIGALVVGAPEPIAVPVPDPARAWEATLSPQGLFRMLVLSWFVGPVIEEIVFRGFLYRAWERQWGWVASTVLTSACFALVHPTHVTAAFFGSIVYVCVLRRTGSLKACILVHMLFNVLISWPVLGQFLFTAPAEDPAQLSAWTLPVACLAFTAVALPAYVWMARADRRPLRVP